MVKVPTLTTLQQMTILRFELNIMHKSKIKYWLVLPAVITMLLVVIYPLFYSIGTSFTRLLLNRQDLKSFYWFNNFVEIFQDPRMLTALWVTLRLTITSLIFEMIIGYLLASSLARIPFFRNFFLSILLVPMMISSIAVGLIWRLLLHSDLGIINYMLDLVGIGGRNWLALRQTALPTVIFITVWQWTPFAMLLIFAGLISLPIDPYEAAEIDGANAFQKFRYLTFPFMRYVFIIIAAFRTIDLLKTYDLIYILTQGGPGSTTETLGFYIFYLAFTKLNIGQASAGSFVFTIIIVILTSFLLSWLREREGILN